MILLHGVMDNAQIWDSFAFSASDHLRIIALDQRGHGDSDWASPPAYNCNDYVRDLSEFIETLGVNEVILMGHSMGAFHAIKYTSMKPEKVKGLIHVDIEPSPPPENREYLNGRYNTQPSFYNSLEDYMGRIRKTIQYAGKDMIRNFASSSLKEGNDGKFYIRFDKEVLKHFDQYDLLPHVRDITCPTLIIRGEEIDIFQTADWRRYPMQVISYPLITLNRFSRL
ncbi:MAG: alpha/beta hydrolase [Deltaproteobacteria bacterium]|nr:alpha/beta hydrolase [Deltaproteobacteria bacterium]